VHNASWHIHYYRPVSAHAGTETMKTNRKLAKRNLKGHLSETTEQNERLRIWLVFVGSLASAILGAFFRS
jgi:hypothetical protein